MEDRAETLTHCNTSSYSLIHYSWISPRNAAEDVTLALKCINVTQSRHGASGANTRVCVCLSVCLDFDI